MEAHDLDHSTSCTTTNPSLLCLKCRQTGHIVDKCPSAQWFWEFGWFFSPARKRMDFGDAMSTSKELCKRCRDLDLLRLLREEIPWKSTYDLNQAVLHGNKSIQSLGKTGSIKFWKDCPLCRCLFAMTPHPSSSVQDVLIIPTWTMHRLTGECNLVMDTEEKRQYAKCLLVALNPSSLKLDFSITAHRGDALCIIEDDLDDATTLGGRLIDPYHINSNIIEEWFSSCSQLHGVNCAPLWTQDLQDIRLVDVSNRKIVRYPESRCDYIALSYVWGGVAQRSFQLESVLSKLPQTIEDAIAFVKKLGKQYLWVDSLCIDQNDETDKNYQIGKMWSIYRGAYVTIIALSGSSADAGLPRLGSNSQIYPQLTCCIDGKRLVGLMPTLTQQIWVAPWGSRAWTLQEALLSPRCLYISDHQLYFECNAMQCSESLNQTKSWAHLLCHNSNFIQDEWLEAQVGSGCLRNPVHQPSRRLAHYGAKITLYSYRSMTKDIDGLNAFTGILKQLEILYKEGFFWGLPVADFQWGLLWRSQSPPKRRVGFPTWSWAGWEGGVWAAHPFDIKLPRQFPVHLHIWKALDGQLVQFFRTPQGTDEDANNIGVAFQNDPVTKSAQFTSTDPEFDIRVYPKDVPQKAGYLFVEAIAFQFIPDYSRPIYKTRERGKYELFVMSIRGTSCRIKIMSTDIELDPPTQQIKRQFLLLARDRREGLVYHYLLLLHSQEHAAARGTVLELLVPEDKLEVLKELEPRKRRVVLL